MAEAADQKVTEIGDSRRQLETDLVELEARLPTSLRSSKAMAGLLVGSGAVAALVLRKRRSKRSASPPAAEVVVRIVRDDL